MQGIGDFGTQYHFERIAGKRTTAGQFQVLLWPYW